MLKRILRAKEEEIKDTGLSEKFTSRTQNIINPDGSFNVPKTGIGFRESFNFYHWLVNLSHMKFILLVLIGYIIVNCFFAVLYVFAGVTDIGIPDRGNVFGNFLEAFFFSSQTLTTLGYGRVNPQGIAANVIASLEALVGLTSFAVATSLLYGRFTKPKVKIIRSRNALIAPFRDGKGFMFRIANGFRTNIIDAEVQVVLSLLQEENGTEIRKFYSLDLEYRKINFFASVWTVNHIIDENSPLAGLTKDDLDKTEAEFLVLFKGYDDTFTKTVNTRFSYRHSDVVWNAKFRRVLLLDEQGRSYVALDKINDYELA